MLTAVILGRGLVSVFCAKLCPGSGDLYQIPMQRIRNDEFPFGFHPESLDLLKISSEIEVENEAYDMSLPCILECIGLASQ